MPLRPLAAIFAALMLVACATVQEAPRTNEAAVRETMLGNGLRVIVKEDHRSPVVVSQLWYRVGSADEEPGHTGVSHALEHMMFKGTRRYGPGEFSRIVAENGGSENAFTGRDYTVYFQQLEKSRLPIAFELEADRMQNLLLRRRDFAREIKVVMEERRLRTDDQPDALLYEKFMTAAYRVSPYRNPVIGWMPDLKRMTVDDVRAWYRRWYVPNNATLVVVGDVEPEAVFDLARQYFGHIPRRPIARRLPPSEPAQKAARETAVKTPAEVPSLIIGFHVPRANGAAADWQPYALEVLAGLLGGSDSSRLVRGLVRGQQIAADASADYDPNQRYPGMLLISATPARGESLDHLASAIRAEVAQLRRAPASAAEIERVKAQVVAQNVYDRDSMFYQGMEIGALESVGLDWHLLDQYVARIRSVTAQKVQQVAQEYLEETNMTVAMLRPLPLSGASRPLAPAARGAYVR